MMVKSFLYSVLVLGFALGLNSVQAQSKTTKKSNSKKSGTKKYNKKKKIKNTKELKTQDLLAPVASFSSTLNSSLHETSSVDHQLNADFLLSGGVTTQSKNTFKLNILGNQNYKGTKEFKLGDAFTSATMPLIKNDDLSISGIMRIYIPTSEKSRDLDHLRFGGYIAPTFTSTSLYKGLTAILRPSIRVNSHQFKTSLSGNSNTNYSWALRAILAYEINDSWSLVSLNEYARAYTYNSNEKDQFLFYQAVGYNINKNLSFSFGHVNGGSPLAANGTDTEVDIIDNKSSNVFVELSLSY